MCEVGGSFKSTIRDTYLVMGLVSLTQTAQDEYCVVC